MKRKSIIFASGLLGSAAIAQDLNKSFGDGTMPEFLMRYDVNDDGIIDEEERQAIKEERKMKRESRPNRSGKTSLEKRLAARDSIRERILSKRTEKFAEIAGEDGVLSLEELSSLPPFRTAFKERIESIFARLDSDNSGDVSLEEFNQRLRNHRPSNEAPWLPAALNAALAACRAERRRFALALGAALPDRWLRPARRPLDARRGQLE